MGRRSAATARQPATALAGTARAGPDGRAPLERSHPEGSGGSDSADRSAAYLRWAEQPPERVLQEVDSRADGLSSETAEVRLRADGPNVLPAPAGPGVARMALRQLVHFFALMLWAAAALALFAGAPQLSVAIVLVIVVNALFSFAQEFRAGRAVRALSALMPSSVTVIREGRQSLVPAAELVRGDVVLLREGDHVPVDARLLRSDGLT